MSEEARPSQRTLAIGRRDVLWGAGGAAIATVAAVVMSPSKKVLPELEETRRKLEEATLREEGRKKAQAILRAPGWTDLDLNAFLDGLSAEGLQSMRKALDMDGPQFVPQLQVMQQDISELRKRFLWYSTNIVEWPFRDENNIQYHEVVKWVAKEAKVQEEITNSQSTFIVEHSLCQKLFADIWDKLTQNQRMDLLAKIDAHGKAEDHAAIASLSGAAAITALSVTVYFSGFAFYTAMSITISAVAGWFGLTLPIAAYTGASSLVAFLTGPVGWAFAATAAVVGVALLGRANVKQTTAAVIQIHTLKVAALAQIQPAPDDIFSIVGRRVSGSDVSAA